MADQKDGVPMTEEQYKEIMKLGREPQSWIPDFRRTKPKKKREPKKQKQGK